MNDEIVTTYKLRVPSEMAIVTITNIRKFIDLLPKLPDRFQNNDIAENEEFPLNNENAVSRLLSYNKYLGILEEERVKEKYMEQNKEFEVTNQFFSLTDLGIKLKEGMICNPDNKNRLWTEILKESELYKSLIENEEYKRWKYISKTNLRKLLSDSFTKRVTDRKARVDEAEKFLINFLKDAGLFTFDGTYLKPIGQIEKEVVNEKSDEKIPIKTEDIKESIGNEPIQPSKGFTYIKDDNFELKIRLDKLSLKLLEEQVKFLKTKLESINNEQKNEEKK